ncbi:MAG: hypothetical protein ACLFQ8_02790 [Candidatus Aenigmatarchaeota archaeon]
MVFIYFYLSLISDVEEELKREVPDPYHGNFWFTRTEAREIKDRVNERFWSSIRKNLYEIRTGKIEGK